LTATSAIIPASGVGRRLSTGSGKSFVTIAGQPLLTHTLRVFQDCEAIDEIVLVVQAEKVSDAKALVRAMGFSKVRSVTPGGEERQDSVRNGLARISPECDIVAIHDGARPLVTPEIITASIEAARSDGAAIAAVPIIDTIKTSPDGRFVSGTLDRQSLYAVQTPQTFAREIIEKAYKKAVADGYFGTDDASLVERLGIPVRIVPGAYQNIKITTPIDIAIAEALLLRSEIRNPKSEIRVGHGYDIHRLAPGRKLYLAGIEFPGEDGLLGHSDADVLIHAVIDAILGAAGLGDIGRHFPDNDPAYKDMRSTILLQRVAALIEESAFRVNNLDITVVAERPKIAKHVPAMQANIARILGIAPEQVSIKGKTSEGLGPIGEGLGIECHAVALVVPLTG
jgi:2-C-methyl-D-erythritol 4-phosphate cytidylyltransferase / 2-C-methyl-D-erythritol 2,4-cyclodiphosphate synthase